MRGSTISSIRLFAPAKLNLYLRVIGRRPDGYHDLETLFEQIDLADEIALTPQPKGITVSCDDPTLDCGPENLATKAALLLQQTSGIVQGVAIHITKRIPISSGLGGGSSDAATVLLGLNQLWGLQLTTQQLHAFASQLGSDVPFFIEQVAFAIGRGRGDACESLGHNLPTLWHVLVAPKMRLSTQAVYDGFDASRAGRSRESGLTGPAPSLTMCLHALRNGSLGELAEGLLNDLQPEAIRRCPVLTDLHQQLRACGSLGTLTSGSGPSVFGLCRDRSHAQDCLRAFDRSGLQLQLIQIVSTLTNRVSEVRASG